VNSLAKQLSIGLLVVVGIALIAYQTSLVKWTKSSADLQRPVIATVLNLSGEVRTKPNQVTESSAVSEGGKIFDLDTLEVSALSTAKIRFSSGLVIDVLADSTLFFESGESIFVTFRKGDYRVASKGQGGEKVLFVKDGAVVDPLGRTPQKPIVVTTEPKATPEKPLPQFPEAPAPADSLSDEYISSIMVSQKNFLNKCYASFLKENPNNTGELFLSFTITQTGNVRQVRVLKSSINDTRLQKCASDVVERTTFKNFAGDPIVVNYPIFFE